MENLTDIEKRVADVEARWETLQKELEETKREKEMEILLNKYCECMNNAHVWAKNECEQYLIIKEMEIEEVEKMWEYSKEEVQKRYMFACNTKNYWLNNANKWREELEKL